MGFRVVFSTGLKIRIPDIEVKELISKFLNMNILVIDNNMEETVYPIISKYQERR